MYRNKDGTRKIKNFFHNYALVAEKERIHCINKHFDDWYLPRKPKESIVCFEDLKQKNKYKTI